MPSRRDVAIRLSAEGVRQTEGQLTGLGTRGQQALQRLERSTSPVSRGLIAVDRATGGLRNQMEGLSHRLGIVGDAMRALGPAGLAGAAAIAGLATGFTATVRAASRAIESLSAIGSTADRLGVTAEQLQELRFAAEQNNVAVNTLETAWQRFTRRLGEAQQGGGELLDTLEQYNIALQNADGTNRTVIEVYRDLADAVQRVRDPQEQLRIAFKAFDSEGASLVRLLRQGADGFDGLARSARESGVVIENEIVQRALEAGDRINALEQRQEAALNRIGAVFTGSAELWEQSATAIVEAVADIVEAFDRLESIGPDSALGRAMPGTGLLPQLQERFDREVADINRLFVEQGREIPASVQARLDITAAALAEAARRAFEEQGGLSQFPTTSASSSPAPVPPRRPVNILTDSERKELEAQQKAAEKALEAQLSRGAAVAASVRTPYEEMVTKQQELNELLDAGAINMETFERASKQAFVQLLESTDGMDDGLGETADAAEDAAARMEAAWDEATRGMTRALTDFFVTGELDFRRFIGNIAAALLQAQLDRLIVQPAKDVLGGFGDLAGNFLSGLFGPGPGNIGPTGASFADELAGGVRALHSGGVVGRDGTPRHGVPAAAWLDAPKFHRGGFVPGEVPIIAQVHERVLTEAQQRNTADTIQGLARMAETPAAAPEISVEIIDQRGSGEPVQAERVTRPDGGQGLRLTIRDVTRGLFTSGAFDSTLSSNFGIKRRA